MKNLILALVLAASTTSCLGTRARTHALTPGVALAMENVMEDITQGLSDAVLTGEMDDAAGMALLKQAHALQAALDLGDVRDIRKQAGSWSTLKTYAERGVQSKLDSGKIGEGLAGSKREQVRQVDRGLAKITEPRFAVPIRRSGTRTEYLLNHGPQRVMSVVDYTGDRLALHN